MVLLARSRVGGSVDVQCGRSLCRVLQRDRAQKISSRYGNVSAAVSRRISMGTARGEAVGCAASPLLSLLELNNVAFLIPAVEHDVASKAPSCFFWLEVAAR